MYKRQERYRRVDYDQFIEACAWPEYKKLLLNYVKNRNQSISMNSVAGIAYTLEHRVEDLLATELEAVSYTHLDVYKRQV